ncbi:sel1 repeat family protein, partial [bacterium]|nr:sel1 repeat family protein [bacterium]
MKFFLKNSKILYLCFSLSSIVFSQELLLRKCNVPYLGTWVDLSTLNRFEFDSGCGFRFEGAGCTVSGEYFSSESSEGTTTLLNKVSPTHSTCFSKGEHSCTYSVYKNSLVLKCPTKQAITFVRQIRRAVSSLKGLSGTAKTLSLLQTGPPESLKSHLEQLSDEGAVEASSALGYNHFYGSRELKQDFSEALYWNRLAASQGSHISKVLVGTQYLYGLGVPTDKAKAEEFFLSAAKENDVVPQKALAGMYLMQPNKIKNREKAIYWLTQAVSLGDQQARDFLKGLKPEEEKNL